MPFIYLIIILLPSYLIRFSVFGFKTNLLDVLLVVFFVFWLIKRLVTEKYGVKNLAKDVFLKIKPYLLPIVLILAGLLLSIFKSGDLYMSLGIIKSWFVLPILFFVAVADFLCTEKQKNSVLKAWILSGFLVSAISLAYYFGGELTYDGRLKGFFSSPNYLAMFLAPAMIAGIWFLSIFEWGSSKYKVLKYYFITVFIGSVIFLTKSLGVFLAVLFAVAPILYRYLKNKKNKIVAIVILILLVFGFLVLVLGKDFSGRSSLASRFMIWQSAIEILNDNSVLGVGAGMFQEKYLEYQYKFEPYLEWAVPQPHNILLAFWLQAGLIGFIGFMWLLAVFFKNNWPEKDKFSILAMSLMAYFLIHGLFDNTYWKNDLAVMFWLVVALSLKIRDDKNRQY